MEQPKLYYSNARLGGQTCVLAGPYLTVAEAEATLDIVGPAFLNERPEARMATFGVMQVNVPGCGEGRYNKLVEEKGN
jgi:hypothetical protein